MVVPYSEVVESAVVVADEKETQQQVKEIEEYASVQKWLINLTRSTKHTYIPYFTEFCRVFEKTPDQLLAMAKTDEGIEQVHDLAKLFYEKLAEQSQSTKT